MDYWKNFKNGFKAAIPICILYFGVSISLGFACSEAHFTVFESALMSMINLTSAGEFAGIQIISNGGTYSELVISQVVINLRYLLMSAALLMKLRPEETIGKRLLMGYTVTDEIFALSAAQKNPLCPLFTFGAGIAGMLGWVSGTAFGALMGNILPDIIVSAFSIAIYAMFISVVLLPARKDRILLYVAIISMALSTLFGYFFTKVQSGIKCVILTVVISAVAAYFFPHEEEV